MIDQSQPLSVQVTQAWQLRQALRSAAADALLDDTLSSTFLETYKLPSLQEVKSQFASAYSGQPLLQKMLDDMSTPDDYRYPSSVGGCFVAGTLVWTDAGLRPIEQIKIGDRVLSQPDSTGEREYRSVVRTMAYEDKIVVSVRYQAADNYDLNVLHATGNHPFWVEGLGWTAAEKLMAGQQLQLANGTLVYVVEVGPVYRTDRPNIGWEPEFYDHVCEGVEGDFSHGWKRVGGDGDYYNTRKPAEAFSDDPYLKVPVYNIEVEGFHTYYVGTTGVWVHNADCSNVELLDRPAFRRHLRAIISGSRGGRYEWRAIHG